MALIKELGHNDSSSLNLLGFEELSISLNGGNSGYQNVLELFQDLYVFFCAEQDDLGNESLSELEVKARLFSKSLHNIELRNSEGNVFEDHIIPIVNSSVDFVTKQQVSADVETIRILAYLHDFVEDFGKELSKTLNGSEKFSAMDHLWIFLEKNFGEQIVKRLKLLNMDYFSQEGVSKEVQDLERAYIWIKKINEMRIEEAIVKFHDLLNNADGTILRPTKFYQRFLIISALNVKFPGKFDTLTQEFYSRYIDKQPFPDVKADFLPLIKQITDPEITHFFSNLSPETLVSGIYQYKNQDSQPYQQGSPQQ